MFSELGVAVVALAWHTLVSCNAICAQAARAAGHPLTVETCPHYLLFSSEHVGNGRTEFKCAPPIRGADNRAALLAAVAHGDIQTLASDHSPSTPDLKHTDTGDFLKAWGGIAGVCTWLCGFV